VNVTVTETVRIAVHRRLVNGNANDTRQSSQQLVCELLAWKSLGPAGSIWPLPAPAQSSFAACFLCIGAAGASPLSINNWPLLVSASRISFGIGGLAALATSAASGGGPAKPELSKAWAWSVACAAISMVDGNGGGLGSDPA